MNREDMLRLRAEFDTTDQSDAIEHGALVEDGDPDPMVTTSVRLPKSLLDWVRGQADAERIKSTALVRRWIEEKRDRGGQSLAVRLERLENHVYGKDLVVIPNARTESEPALPETVLQNANRLASFIKEISEDPGPQMDAQGFMDANVASQAIKNDLHTVPNPAVRNALFSMIAAWENFRDKRVQYNVVDNRVQYSVVDPGDDDPLFDDLRKLEGQWEELHAATADERTRAR